MVSAELRICDTVNPTTKYKYVIDGFLIMKERVSQSTTDISLPFTGSEDTQVIDFSGEKRFIQGSFIIMARSDDFTLGTAPGYVGDKGLEAQKYYLLNIIKYSIGKNEFVDEAGVTYSGKLDEIEISKQGDEPLMYTCNFSFKIGKVFTDYT